MKLTVLAKKFTPRFAALTLLVVCGYLLTSCSTAPKIAAAPVFKFTVLRYPEPVAVQAWRVDPAQSANPEGAALNILAAMQHGDVDAWLASWVNTDRPTLTKEQRDAVAQKWHALQSGHVSVLGRVVAGADVIIELTVINEGHPDQKIQLPLEHADDHWWLTEIDAQSEYLNWENSPNKILVTANAEALKAYLNSVSAVRVSMK